MSKQTEALKLALESAANYIDTLGGDSRKYRQALAEQPAQQEPYGWHTEDHLTDRSATTYSKDVADRWKSKGWPVTPLYTSPQSKSWVHATTWRGLTDEEWQEIDASLNGKRDLARIFTRAIEAKLKEKNA